MVIIHSTYMNFTLGFVDKTRACSLSAGFLELLAWLIIRSFTSLHWGVRLLKQYKWQCAYKNEFSKVKELGDFYKLHQDQKFASSPFLFARSQIPKLKSPLM